MITGKTRVTESSETLIDVLLTTMPELHTHNEVFEFSLSDHFMIYSCIDVPKMKRQHKSVRYRCYKHFEEQSYVEDVMNSLVFCGIANSDKNQGDTETIWSDWES